MTDLKVTVNSSRLRLARRVRKITQVRLSELASVSQSLISFMEASNVDTDPHNAEAIAGALDVSVDWLSGESDKGGVQIQEGIAFTRKTERDKISQRFIEVYSMLKNLGIIPNDFDFAQKVNMNPGNLSNMLSGKYNVKLDLIPALAEYGASVDYIYDGRMPKLQSGAGKKLKSTEDTIDRLEALIEEGINVMTQAKMMLMILRG